MSSSPIELYMFEPAFGLPVSESPPATKVQLYCHLTGRDYIARLGDTRRSPNHMIPYVRWPDGTWQAESWDILERLEAESDEPLDENLNREALRSGRALAEAVELICYDACLYDRFVRPEGWALQRPILRAYVAQLAPWIAWPMIPLVVWAVRRKQRDRAHVTMADISSGQARVRELVQEVARRLEQAPFLCGDRPSTIDCAIWATLLHLAATPVMSTSRDAVREQPLVMDWIARVAGLAGLEIGSLGMQREP